MSEIFKIQQYSIRLQIQFVKIQVKFPCKITASVKIGKIQTISIQQITLSNGQASFTKPFQITTKLKYNPLNNCCLDIKSYISINIISKTGKNIAGICNLELTKIINQSQNGAFEKALQRCPDKNAKIKYNIYYQLLNEIDQESSKAIDDLSHSAFFLNKSNSQIEIQNSLTAFRVIDQIDQSSYNSGDNSNKPIQPYTKKHSAGGRIQIHSQSIINNDSKNFQSNVQISRAHSHIDTNEKSRRIRYIQSEKAESIRSINDINAELEIIKNNNWQLKKENEKKQKAIENLKNEIEKFKLEKQEIYQKLVQYHQLKEEENLKKMKEIQKMKQISQETQQLDDADKKNIESLKIEIEKMKLRFENKQAYYIQDINKYHEQIIMIQSERLRLTNQISELNEKLYKKQRRSKSPEKNKEQMLKLTNMINQYQKQMQKLKTKIEQYQKKQKQIQCQMQYKMKQIIQQYQQKITQIKNKNQRQLIQQEIYKKEYEDNIRILKKQIQQIQNQKVKEINRLNIQNNNLREKSQLNKSPVIQNNNTFITQLNKLMSEKQSLIKENLNLSRRISIFEAEDVQTLIKANLYFQNQINLIKKYRDILGSIHQEIDNNIKQKLPTLSKYISQLQQIMNIIKQKNQNIVSYNNKCLKQLESKNIYIKQLENSITELKFNYENILSIERISKNRLYQELVNMESYWINREKQIINDLVQSKQM